MVAKIIRLSVVVGCSIFGIMKFIQNDFYGGAALFFAAGIIIFSHYRNSYVKAVVNYVKSGDYGRAKKLLNEIPSVKLLSKGNKGYYYWSRAYIKIDENDTKEIEEDFIKSLEYSLKDSNDEAMANASLAELYIHSGDNIKAKEHLDKALELSNKEGLNKKLEKLKEKLQ